MSFSARGSSQVNSLRQRQRSAFPNRKLLHATIVVLTAVGALAFASPAHASTEAAPHRGTFAGIDLNVNRSDVKGIQVRSLLTGHMYCVDVQQGWNAIPTESTKGAQLYALSDCTGRFSVANTSADVKGGEHWELTTQGMIKR